VAEIDNAGQQLRDEGCKLEAESKQCLLPLRGRSITRGEIRIAEGIAKFFGTVKYNTHH
jgi:hypothetical protein